MFHRRRRGRRLEAAVAITLLLGAEAGSRAGTTAEAASAPEAGHEDHVSLAPDPTLSLRDALEAALDRDPARALLEARRDEADLLARAGRAWTPDAPALAASGASDALGPDDGYRFWTAGLEVPLWLPGQRAARGRVARHARAGVAVGEVGRALGLAAALREQLAGWARARARVEVGEHALDAARALEATLRRAAALGDVAAREALLAEEETLGRSDALYRARAELRDIELRYEALTGLDRVPEIAVEPLAPMRPLDEGHPLLAEADTRVARAEAQLAASTHDQWGTPLLSIFSEHERDLSGSNTSDRIGLGLRVPLGRSNAMRQQLAAARLELGAARAERARLRREIEVELHDATHQLTLAEARLTVAEARADLARRNLRLEERAFALGESDLQDRLRIQARAFDAELAVHEARADRQLALARHNQALGVLP